MTVLSSFSQGFYVHSVARAFAFAFAFAYRIRFLLSVSYYGSVLFIPVYKCFGNCI